jgi:hypothetical protein
MRLLLIGLLPALLPMPGFAQSNDAIGADQCRAPVSLSDTACSMQTRDSRSADRAGTMEQRDDGYFVFVPQRKE